MPSVIHGVSWLFMQTSRHTGPVVKLGPCDSAVWGLSSSSGCVHIMYLGACILEWPEIDRRKVFGYVKEIGLE
jgi:hypothetical protein